MKVYVFIQEATTEGFRIVALREDGKLMADDVFRSSAIGRTNMARRFDLGTAVWVDSPNDHPGVLEACKLLEESEAAAEQEAWEESRDTLQRTIQDESLDPAVIHGMTRGLHLCVDCVHRPVCGVSIAAQLQEQLGGLVVVSACLHHSKRE